MELYGLSDRKNTCCFTGHRSLTDEEKRLCLNRLNRSVEKLILTGVTNFITGGALGFDTIAEISVLTLKRNKYPKIKMTVAVPFKGQSDRWNAADRALYRTILSEADEVITLFDSYNNRCMSVRNRFMVDNSAFCISYVKKKSGGSFYTENYAKLRGLNVLNLAYCEEEDRYEHIGLKQ